MSVICEIISRDNDRGCVVHDCTWIETPGSQSKRCPLQLLADLASTIEDAKQAAASDAGRAERERVLGLIETELGLKTGHDVSLTGASLASVIRRIREAP